MRLLWFVFGLSMLPAYVSADDAPRSMIRAHLEPAGTVVVGQPMKLIVDVLVTTWFTGAPELPMLDMPGALVTVSDEAPAHLTETIDGVQWFGLSRIYRVTPMEPRDYVIPRLRVQIHQGLVGRPVTVWTPVRRMTARVPAGAEGMAEFFATSRLDVAQTFDRGLPGLRVGDAVTRTIVLTAQGTPGMFLPPISFIEVEGLALYPNAPRVENISKERQGFLAGRRTESVTYTLERAGKYELPSITVQWWDTHRRKLREHLIPPVVLEVSPNPNYRPDIAISSNISARLSAEGEALRPSRLWVVGVLGIVGVIVLLWPQARQFVKKYMARRVERQRQYQDSERAAFARLEKAVRHADDIEAVRCLYQWLDRTGGEEPALVGRSAALAHDDLFERTSKGLLSGRFGPAAVSRSNYSSRDFGRSLHHVRQRLLAEKEMRPEDDERPLAPLNPK
ncbi:hypothetical protein W02_17610 [Nitrospira sp. KM1]|uniref:BatD family protein n=1 Tax=Nitrospira sp. KM1 TaxID=1936990 RepID=UPI0013A79A0F|nr:BatD family protein [Nitrospira sp. KM1]BCA54621.1 hypothetical protein W02_17610 [Nitrospira sp. KM1]